MSNISRLTVHGKGNNTGFQGPVLSTDLSVDYPARKGVLRSARVEVLGGEIVGLVGESGSGKSTLALAILRLLDGTRASVRGRVKLLGEDISLYSERQMRQVRGRLVSLVPQSPATALNPALRIGTQLREAWRAHSNEPWAAQESFCTQLLAIAGLPLEEDFLKRFPGQISIGQAQRVLIIMALIHSPSLLIADEPTSALDVITQREVLDLLVRIARENRMGMLFISHDLSAVAERCDRLAILYAGEIVECGIPKNLLSHPQHFYTKELIAAAPKWAP